MGANKKIFAYQKKQSEAEAEKEVLAEMVRSLKLELKGRDRDIERLKEKIRRMMK